jgi:hypothetical protein
VVISVNIEATYRTTNTETSPSAGAAFRRDGNIAGAARARAIAGGGLGSASDGEDGEEGLDQLHGDSFKVGWREKGLY